MAKFTQSVIDQGISRAIAVSKQAYSPYSKLNVGAAFLINSAEPQWAEGCNVENASFGATICAERMAVGQVIKEFKPSEVEALFLYSTFQGPAIPPCGMCLQVMAEFFDGSLPVFLSGAKGLEKETTLSELFPVQFSKESLPQQ